MSCPPPPPAPTCPDCGASDGYVPEWWCDACSGTEVASPPTPSARDITDRDGSEDWIVDPETGCKS